MTIVDDALVGFLEPTDWRVAPGVAVAVVQHDAVAETAVCGMANIEHGVAIDGRTQFDLGSLSKQFVGSGRGAPYGARCTGW